MAMGLRAEKSAVVTSLIGTNMDSDKALAEGLVSEVQTYLASSAPADNNVAMQGFTEDLDWSGTPQNTQDENSSPIYSGTIIRDNPTPLSDAEKFNQSGELPNEPSVVVADADSVSVESVVVATAPVVKSIVIDGASPASNQDSYDSTLSAQGMGDESAIMFTQTLLQLAAAGGDVPLLGLVMSPVDGIPGELTGQAMLARSTFGKDELMSMSVQDFTDSFIAQLSSDPNFLNAVNKGLESGVVDNEFTVMLREHLDMSGLFVREAPEGTPVDIEQAPTPAAPVIVPSANDPHATNEHVGVPMAAAVNVPISDPTFRLAGAFGFALANTDENNVGPTAADGVAVAKAGNPSTFGAAAAPTPPPASEAITHDQMTQDSAAKNDATFALPGSTAA